MNHLDVMRDYELLERENELSSFPLGTKKITFIRYIIYLFAYIYIYIYILKTI